MRSMGLVLALALITAGCGDDGINSPADPDQSVLRFDVLTPDVLAADTGGGAKEAGGPADAAGDAGTSNKDGGKPSPDGGLAADSATPTGCNVYSNWSCKVGQGALLCITKCGADELTCTNGGVCQCGIGLGPCKGVYSGATPCDVCRKAWLAGCCQ
jgi:hypothetical protein